MRARAHTHTHAYIRTHTYIHTGTQGHTHLHTYTCTHTTHVHTRALVCLCRKESLRKADYTLENSTFAGDLPSHTIALAKKKLRYDINSSVTGWCVDILQDRQEQTTQEITCKQDNVTSVIVSLQPLYQWPVWVGDGVGGGQGLLDPEALIWGSDLRDLATATGWWVQTPEAATDGYDWGLQSYELLNY